MKTIADRESNWRWRVILWTLQITVALQCLGNWRWFTQIQETPLLHWLINPHDIGGLGWDESTALTTQQIVGWLVLLAGGVVLWRPRPVVLGALALLQTLIAVAMWRLAEGYALQTQWIPPQLLTLFPLATQMARMVAPLGLMLLVRPGDQKSRLASAVTLLRWTIAIVFLTHGIEAWQQNPKFLDLLIGASQRLLGLSLPQSLAEQILTVIGGVDVLLAIACVSIRSSSVLWWMVIWGAITAFSRIAAHGWPFAWHETFTRITHIGLPLAVVLGWHLLKYESRAATPAKDLHKTV